MDDMVRKLIADLERLDGMPRDAERARLARELSDRALAALQADGDATVYAMSQAKPRPSRDELAAELGVSKGRVDWALTRHRARLRAR